MPKLAFNTHLLFDSKEDEQSVINMMTWQRSAFNECSELCFNLKKKSIIDLHKAFYSKFRSDNPDIPSQLVIIAQRECLSRYKSSKSNKHKLKKPIHKKKLSVQLDKRVFSVKKDGYLSIIGDNGRVICSPFVHRRLEPLWGVYKICDPNLFIRDGKVWISFVFDIPEVPLPKTSTLGIDLGVRQFAVSSEGIVYDDKEFKKRKRSLRYLKRSLQSKGTKSAKKHLKKLRNKEKNQNKNFTHNIVNQILSTECDVIAIENLKGIKKKKHDYENKNRISQVPLFEFRRVLEYKASLAGKTVIAVDPRNTSKTDHATGRMDGDRKGRRYYSKTGKVWDAEINAAINIARRANHPVSFCEPLDGTLKPFRQADCQPANRISVYRKSIALQAKPFKVW